MASSCSSLGSPVCERVVSSPSPEKKPSESDTKVVAVAVAAVAPVAAAGGAGASASSRPDLEVLPVFSAFDSFLYGEAADSPSPEKKPLESDVKVVAAAARAVAPAPAAGGAGASASRIGALDFEGPPSRFPRKYPHANLHDTKGRMSGGGGYRYGRRFHYFSDAEIVEHHKPVKDSQSTWIEYSVEGRAIIQQQGLRACTATSAAMLILDRGGKVDWLKFSRCNLGDAEDIMGQIRCAGLEPVMNKCRKLDDLSKLEDLRKLLLDHGSGEMTIKDPDTEGAHSIVVDEISEDLARVKIRDPYHGWQITVTADAFLRYQPKCKIIQIAKREES